MFPDPHESARMLNLTPGTRDYDVFIAKRIKDLQNMKLDYRRYSLPPPSPLSPLSPLSPVSPSSSSCIGRLNGLESKPELNGSFAIIKEILPNGRILVIPITTSSAFSVSPEKIINIPTYDIQLGGRKRKSRKNRYKKNSRRTRHSTRTRRSRRTRHSRRTK